MKKLVLTALVISLFSTSVFAYEYKIVHQAVGCITNEDHSKFTNYLIQKDEEALKKFLTLKLVTGECTVFSVNEPVNVTDTALFSGMIQIRRHGEIKEFWTNFEYVKSVDQPKPIEPPKPVEQVKVQMTPQLKKEMESKKCVELQNDSEVMACLNKIYSKN
jgi:hypothetical protein